MKRSELNKVAQIINEQSGKSLDELRAEVEDTTSKADARRANAGRTRENLIAAIVYEEMESYVSPDEEDVD